MRGLLLSVALLASSATAHAQAPNPLPVHVEDGGSVEAAALREALADDLGVTVLEASAEDAQLIVERDSEGTLRLRVRLPGEDERLRAMVSIEDGHEVTLAVALIAANLVRNESSELIALLIASRRVAVAPQPEPPEPEPPVVVFAPEAELDGGPESELEREPEPEPEPQIAPEPEPQITDAFGMDFVPGLGSSTAYGADHRRSLSIGVIGGLSGGIDGVALSSVFDIAAGDVNGVQMAGVLAIAGPVSGLQSGLVSISAGEFEGLQMGLVDVAGPVAGVQMGLVDVAGGDVEGLQLGLLNIAGGVRGAQIGLLNIAAGRVEGAQIGLLNIAEEADASIGLLSVQGRSENHLRLFGETSGLLGAEFVHGNTTRMILSAASQPFLEAPVAALGVGLGLHIDFDEALHLDVETHARVLLDDRLQDGPESLMELRVLFGGQLADGFGLYGGIGYQLRWSGRRTPNMRAPIGAHVLSDSGTQVEAWPTLIAGIELF